MFRLESYITPILLEHVSKYVKNIRQEDLQVSLWEGEVALHNLDLRLDVLQEELNLPVEFISGHIHDLSIRVPWTKITSEPITITINTIEFVLKLKNPHEDGASSSASSSPQRMNEKKKKRKCPPKSDDRASNPEASSSWIISKIINNISLQCHNIILKYVEEDIVVSMNIQLLSFESADEKWASAMIDVHPVKVLMRKLVKITDLTICLDKRNTAGQIDVCQEPILYRSSLECRVLLKYNANSPESNRITRIGIFTKLLDMNISSMQIPLCLRLVKLALAFQQGKTFKTVSPETLEDCVEDEQEAPDNQSYLAWAWSKLPSISFVPGYEDEPTNEAPCHTIDIGFYAEQLSFTLKNAEFVTDTHMAATKRIRYSPIVRLVIGGMYSEMVTATARHWTSWKAGVSSISMEPMGAYRTDGSKIIQTDMTVNQRPFIDKSLFDEHCLIADKGWGVTNYEEYSARITDDYLLYRSPVLAFDVIQYQAKPQSGTSNAANANSSGNSHNEDNHNRVQYRVLTAGLTFRYTQTLEQVKHLISEFINSYDYPAYYTENLDGGSTHTLGNWPKLPPPLMEDYDSLMRHIPLCTYKFSMQKITLEIHAKTEMDLSAQRINPKRQQSTLMKSANLPHCVFYLASADGMLSRPLQADKLVHTTCQLPEKPQQLLDACYENYDLQIGDFSCYLVNDMEMRSSCLINIPSLTLKYGNLLQAHHWKDETIELQKMKVQCDQLCFTFSRRELSSSLYLIQCAQSYHPLALTRLLRQEAPNMTLEDNTKLQNTFNGLKLNWQVITKQSHLSFLLNGLESKVIFKQRMESTKQLVLSTMATKGNGGDILRWLECNILFPSEESVKQKKPKTAIGLWIAPFVFKVDANLVKFLRCRRLEEMERETALESMLQSQVLNLPQNLQSQSGSQVVSITAFPHPIAPPPPSSTITRRSSRNSLPTRKISHPEETIHFSSERDEKLEVDTPHLHSPRTSDHESSTWLTYMNLYVLCVDIEPGRIYIAKNLEGNEMYTKVVLPKITLKPSNLESAKSVTPRQILAAAALKEKSNISWSLVLGDFGVVSGLGSITEPILENIQTTVTIALLHKKEKVRTIPDAKEDSDNQSTPPIDKSPVRKEPTVVFKPATTVISEINRANSPTVGDYASNASVTVGARSERSLVDVVQSEMLSTQVASETAKAGPSKSSPKRNWINRDVFTFNLHADTTPIRLLISSRKIKTFEEHLSILLKVIKLSTPITQPTICSETTNERVEIITATEENATLKEFMELETNSESSKISDKEKETQPVLMLFCQWTITRITLEVEANPLNIQSSKIIVDLEDLLSTVDKREDYTKCTSKIGNLNVSYYEENQNREWQAHDGLTIRLVGESSNLTFLNVIYTSVELKQFFKRIGAKRKGDMNRNLNEIIITMQVLEIITNLERISKFVAAISGFVETCNEIPQESESREGIPEDNANFYSNPIAASDLPMVHLDSKGFILFMPLDKGRDCCSVGIFRIESIKITPNLENPLQRKPIRNDVFSKAAQLGILGTPGSIIEDRQYELTLQNISAATGSWRQIVTHMFEQRDNFSRTNPAAEWNNPNRKPDLYITDIFNNFSFIATYAPSIIYHNVLICGQALEFNCATDFVASINMYQLNMLSCLILHLQRISCFLQNRATKKRTNVSLNANLGQPSTTSFTNTSSSSFSALASNRSSSTALRDIRNSLAFNSIDENCEQNMLASDSGFQSCASHLTYPDRLKDHRSDSVMTLGGPSTPKRQVPQTISLVAGVFLIKFYDVREKVDSENVIEGSIRMLRTPLVSVTLSQPSFMFTQNVYDSITQMSLYDIYVSLATASPIGPISNLVFNEVLLDTRPGHANMAGILPPLFSLRRHCTKMQLRECDIEIAKPIALLFSEVKVDLLCRHLLLINSTLLEDPCFEVRPMRSVVRGSKIRLMRQQCLDADRLHFICRSIVLRFQNENESYNCKLVSSELKFNIKFLNRPEKATAKASIGALYFLVDQKVVVHPINMRLSADFSNEPWHRLPLITTTIKVNMLQLDVGPLCLLHLQNACNGYQRLMENLNQQWKQFLKSRPIDKEHEAMQNKQLELLKCPPTCDIISSSSKTSLDREEFYQDDLRAGAFQFVEMYTDAFLPLPYQIQIIKKNFGIICWRYPQPRKMSKIHVYPVPMAMPNPIHIKCSMEYYSETHETFLSYCEFSLSETDSKQIQLPDRPVCANIWRVVILQSLISVNGACFDGLIPEEEEKSIVSIKIEDVLNNERKESDFILHPKVLVGCMRIDTIFESALVPKIQLLLSCNFVTLKLLNQPSQNGDLPTLLKKFNLAQTTQISQAFLIAQIQNFSVHTAFVSPNNYSIDSETTFGIKCLDYGFLNMVSLLEDTTVQGSLCVNSKSIAGENSKYRTMDLSFVVDRLRLNFGPSIVHSLLSSKMHWEEHLQENKIKHVVVPKCIIVNRTYTYLTFGQTGTSERIQLQVREACLYSFRCDFQNQELTFFITDAETNMTEVSQPVPISFKYPGEVLVQTVRIGQKCLFIKSRKLSAMQIYVLIKGQIELVSMVPHAFRLDFRRESKMGVEKKSMEYVIERRERACFYYSVQERSNISMRLKFDEGSGLSRARSGDIPLKSNKNLPWLVKVPHATAGFISFWVRVFREDIDELVAGNFKPQKILITIWPIFEICSMLSVPIEAQEESMGTQLNLLPEGRYQVLDVPATHLTEHNVKFQFPHPISPMSKDEFNLTLQMIDWKEFFWYDSKIWNIENVLTSLGKGNVAKWPCDDEEELRVRREVSQPVELSLMYRSFPSRELSCAVRLEVGPWGYFINASSVPICLRNDETKIVIVSPNALQMLSTIEKSFTLEVANGTNWVASAPIYFEDTNIPKNSNQYYVLSEQNRTEVVILSGDQIFKFVLSLKIENNRKILKLYSKFVVTNFSKRGVCVLPFAMDHKETATRSHVESLDVMAMKVEAPPVSSRDNCIGMALNRFYDLHAPRAKRTVDTAFVCFASIKVCNETDISIPIPLSMPFTRRCFSAQNGKESVAYAVTLIEHEDIYYLNIFDDTAPALLITNQTDVKFMIAQTSAAENSRVSSTTPEYIGRHFEWFQILPSYSNCYYTPPEMYANFPDVESEICNLTLALYKDNAPKKDIKWSKPIRTDKSWEKFLQIPNHGDVKVIICDKHRVIRVSIFYILQQKEFSVKDLRSRLSTTQPSLDSDDSLHSISSQSRVSIAEKPGKPEVVERCMHYQNDEQMAITTKTLFRMHAYAKEVVLSLHTDDKDRDYIKTEVLSIYVDDLLLTFNDALSKTTPTMSRSESRQLNLLLPNLQIDNQLHSMGKFDFPVIICAQEPYQRTQTLPSIHSLSCIFEDLKKRSPMALMTLKFFDDEMSISDIVCSFSPLRAYIEDAYLNELLDTLVECAPSNCIYVPKPVNKRIELTVGQVLLPRDVGTQAICIAEPLHLRSFRIEALTVLLSVHTSLRLYIALDHSPLSFGFYERQQILTLPIRFGQSLGMHYLSGAIFGAGWVVGSLEILGSPSGLARSVTTGLRDFVAMPVQGLFRGPWGFIVGITQGSASLLRNITAGTVNSLTKLAASVARNLDRLSLDNEHIERTEALRRVRPSTMSEGFSQGLTGLGISILGAVGGVAHHMLEARSPVEVVTGVGKGIVGAFTKPLSGAAELVALTGQGVLQTVGYNALPQQRLARDARYITSRPSAFRIWKLLPNVLATDQVLFYNEITLSVQNQLRSAYVFLTSAVFAIHVSQWDKLEVAYSIHKVELTRDRDDKTLIYVNCVREDTEEFDDSLNFTKERIMSFLRSSHSMRDSTAISLGSLQELLRGSNADIERRRHVNLDWAFYIDENLGEHLMQYLKILHNEI